MRVKKLKVGCFVYTVKFQKSDRTDHGSTDSDNKVIYINANYDVAIQRETLNHEIMHVAYVDFPNFGIEAKPHDREEEVVRFASPRIVQIYQDNKWAREFVFGRS